ncbi:hypothetical protein [Winogradskyella sp.]|uniref:hypothetical protein n=1 Tax=Winogradskyella sp. TaxID=1883156 RepID=UPI0026055EFE|nr:hypothetical protein [Winogradskyella sp.]
MKNDKLHKIKSTGFKTPDDYFESFEDKLFERLEEKATIAGINDTGFKVPKDYFNDLDDEIISKLNTDDKPVVKLNSRKTFYYVAGIAASLALMLAIYINRSDEEISAEMVETYFQESDLDSYELAELLVDAEILEEDFILVEPEYNEENLESYLLENTDIESVLQQ